ncbi:MAG: hypothetical protein ABI921_05810 [Panacibacter sp.]
MKKIIIALAVLFISGTTVVFASDKSRVSETVLQSFQKEFSKATDVSWISLNEPGLYQVKFNYEGESATAYFDEEGSLIAIGRFIETYQLPFLTRKAVESKYADFEIRNILEYTLENETKYLVTIFNDKAVMIVNANSNGGLQLYEKVKK